MEKQNRIPQTYFPNKIRPLKSLLLWTVIAITVASSHTVAQTVSDAEAAYEHGTNSAMRYLANYGVRLRITLLLQECGFSSLSQEIAQTLPNSVAWFLNGDDAIEVPSKYVPFAAQATRAYLLGYEAGVRTEFRRASPRWRETNCAAAALAAKDYISR